MVTIRDVAKAAGVSVATASRALNGLPVVTTRTREKIALAPGESRTVSFTIRPEDLAFTRADMSWGWEPGEFQLWIAPSSGAKAAAPVAFTLTQ